MNVKDPERVGLMLRTVWVPVPVEFPVIAIVPEVVIGDPVFDNHAGNVIATEVTVPDVGVVHNKLAPLDVRTCPLVPTAFRPVPPLVVGRVLVRVWSDTMSP